jgi:hypothetical protein
MWRDANAAAAGLTRAVPRAAHAASHTPTWAIVVGIGVAACLTLGSADQSM